MAALAPRGEARPAESDVRCQEYVAGLRDAGLPVRPERVVRTERVPFASGAAAARALLGQAPDTDAVFALGDALAPGALRGLHDAGRVVPDDTAVAGFANVAQAAFSTPPSPRSAPAARNWPGVPCRSSPNSPGRGRPARPCLPPVTTPSDSASPNGSRVVSQRSEQAPCDGAVIFRGGGLLWSGVPPLGVGLGTAEAVAFGRGGRGWRRVRFDCSRAWPAVR
ncbi:LacI family transcriptional regulator [Streptomyces sp. VN1]|nr:LacI family transcriptional regulator [Streptomyces sp. VN1]